MTLELIATGFWLGVVFNAAPGAVFAESLRVGIRGGFRPALQVQLGSLVGDAVWAVLGLAGAAALLTQPHLRVPITLTGCLVLAFLGFQGIRDGVRRSSAPSETDVGNFGSPLMAGALLSLGNVWNIVYWGGTGGAVAGALGSEAATSSVILFFIAFMLASVLWCFFGAALIAILKRSMKERWIKIVEFSCGVSLVGLAGVLATSVI